MKNMENANLSAQRKAYENEAKKSADSGLGGFIKKILDDAEAISVEEIFYSDAKQENDLINLGYKKELNKVEESSLIYGEKNIGEYDPKSPVYKIEGIIDGKKIKIWYIGDRENMKGTVDGQKISNENAEKIWDKYYPIATERTARLERLKESKLKGKAKDSL